MIYEGKAVAGAGSSESTESPPLGFRGAGAAIAYEDAGQLTWMPRRFHSPKVPEAPNHSRGSNVLAMLTTLVAHTMQNMT